MINTFVKILELLGDRLEVCVSVCTCSMSFISLMNLKQNYYVVDLIRPLYILPVSDHRHSYVIH